MQSLGYSWLCKTLGLTAFPPARPARVDPVSRVTRTPEALLVPANVAPGYSDPIAHLLFALKHEGVNMQVLAQALRKIEGKNLKELVESQPSSRYVRVLGYMWEHFNQQELDHDTSIAGPTIDLFDPTRYLTAPGQRNAKWRVNFNGLGSLDYCVTVERTPEIEQQLLHNTLNRATTFLSQLGQQATDRALSWAYLHETESSYAIERESPSQDKAEAFVALLKQAASPRSMNEAYLVELQNAVLTNPLDMAAAYRHEQNWLRGPLRGAAGITYIPPPPEMVPELMDGVLLFANSLSKSIDPIVSAAIASFGFVFVHPFMDGNGRLSRFLFHYALCQSDRLPQGMLLPVSVAMKRNESLYLKALQSYSGKMRQHWDVRWIGDEEYTFRFTGDTSLYRYWDATECVAFCLNMAEQALEKDLREETEFLAKFDQVYRLVDDRFDVRGNDLTTLIVSSMQNNGRVSNHRRKQFRLTVPEKVFDAIESAIQEINAASIPR